MCKAMRRKVVRPRGPLALRIVLVSQQKRTSYLGSVQLGLVDRQAWKHETALATPKA